MKEIVIDHDIYDKRGTLLVSKGVKLVLTNEKYDQLNRMGIINEIIKPMEKKSMNHHMNNDNISIEETEKHINKVITKISNNFKGLDFHILKKSTDILNNIIFQYKKKDWYRFILLISSYTDWLYTHSLNTAIISCVLGSLLQYSDKKLFEIGIGSLFHDIGLTLLPKETLLTSSELSEVQFTILKNHCEMGYSMMNEVNLPQTSKEIILQHHEKLDGSGYPNKLKESEINPESMITMVAEYFDTATTTVMNKPAEPIKHVIEKMYFQNNIFPRHIVEILMNLTYDQ